MPQFFKKKFVNGGGFRRAFAHALPCACLVGARSSCFICRHPELRRHSTLPISGAFGTAGLQQITAGERRRQLRQKSKSAATGTRVTAAPAVAVAVLSAALATAASAGLALALAEATAAMGTGAEALPLALAQITY